VTQAGKLSSGVGADTVAGAHRQTIGSYRAKRQKLAWPVFLFLIALVVPWVIFVGPLRMSVYRFVLLATVLPCLCMWIAGRAGRIRLADILLLLFWFWCMLGLMVIHGMELSVQTSGIWFVETLGPYLLARCYIRDADDFYNMTQLLFRIVLVLLPFAIVEFLTGQNVLRELFAVIFPTLSDSMPPRWGLTRVQSAFDHPILFGLCTGSVFALVHLVLGYEKNVLQRSVRTSLVGAASILSMSSGPIIAVIAQGLLLSWNSLLRVVKMRWKILVGLLAVMVLLIELVANRSLPAIVSSYLAFDQQSYWFRLLIWDYGSASVLKHPLFGVGLNEWQRPDWMPSSIDNIWLFLAVRYGLPAPLLLLLALSSIFWAVASKKGLDDRLAAYRTAYLITMMAFFLVGWTVHFWDAAYVLFLFLMGSGVWLLDVRSEERAALHVRPHPARYPTMKARVPSRLA
jgi:O-antigen ligase